MLVGPCRLGCGASIAGKNVGSHENSLCPNANVVCPLATFGCRKRVTRANLKDHMADVAHMRLLLVAVSAANEESAAAKAETAQAKTKAKEAKRAAKLAIRELELVKANANKAEGFDTVTHIFSPNYGEISESFRCGGIEFFLKLDKSEADDLCVLLNFKWECTVRLKLKVTSLIRKTAGEGKSRVTMQEKLMLTQSDSLNLRGSPDGSWQETFQEKAGEEGWPTDDKGEEIVKFRVELLLHQVERTLKFD
jgi:hypothetical protein